MPKIKAVKPAVQLDMSEAERMARMREAGMERGFWRGGKSPADGSYYTPDRSAAEAFGARHGPGADVREYALKLGKSFDFSGGVKTSDMFRFPTIFAVGFRMPAHECFNPRAREGRDLVSE